MAATPNPLSFGIDTAHSPFEDLLGFPAAGDYNSDHGIIGTPFLDTLEWDGKQTFPDDCAVRSQQFVLEQFTGEKFDEASLVQEAQNAGIYTPGGGTSPSNVGALLEMHGIGVHHHDDATVSDLADELAQGHKVLVGVDSQKLWGDMPDNSPGHEDHSIVVSGIDTTDPNDIKVMVNDPGTGDFASYPIAHFLASWGDGGFPMVATNDPSPASAPGMAHFDYTAGHIPTVAGIPYDEFHHLHDQPGFLVTFISMLHDFVEKVNDDLLNGGHHSISPSSHDTLQPMPGEQIPNVHSSGMPFPTDVHHTTTDFNHSMPDVPSSLNFHSDTLFQAPLVEPTNLFTPQEPDIHFYETPAQLSEAVPQYYVPQSPVASSAAWFPSEPAEAGSPWNSGQNDSITMPQSPVAGEAVTDNTAFAVATSPAALPSPDSPSILDQSTPTSFSGGVQNSFYQSPSYFSTVDGDSQPHNPSLQGYPDNLSDANHTLDGVYTEPEGPPGETEHSLLQPEYSPALSDSPMDEVQPPGGEIPSLPTPAFPTIDLQSPMPEPPTQSWLQVGDFSDAYHAITSDNSGEGPNGEYNSNADEGQYSNHAFVPDATDINDHYPA